MKMIIRNKGNITIWFWLKFWSWSWCWSWSCSENQLPPLVLFLESNHTQTLVLFIFAFWPLESTFFCEKAAHRKEMRIRQKSYWRFNTSDARHCEASVWKCFKYNCQFPRLGPSRQMEGGKGGYRSILNQTYSRQPGSSSVICHRPKTLEGSTKTRVAIAQYNATNIYFTRFLSQLRDYAWYFKMLHFISSSAWVWLLLLTQYWAAASSFIWFTSCWGKVGAPWVAPSPLNRNPLSTSLQITILCWVNSIHWICCKLSFKERHITLIFDAFALNLGILRIFNANFKDKSTVVLIFTLFYVSCWFSRFSWSAADFAREACFLSCSPSLWSSWISRASPWQGISLPLSLRNIRDNNK